MRKAAPDSTIMAEKTAEAPVVSFAHLSSCFIDDDALNENQGTAYGFPASQEQDLYETGFLLKVFLKC